MEKRIRGRDKWYGEDVKALQEIATDRRAWVGWFRAHVPWRMKWQKILLCILHNKSFDEANVCHFSRNTKHT